MQYPGEERGLKLIIEISKAKEAIKKELSIDERESEDEQDIESFMKRALKFERKEIELIEQKELETKKPMFKPMPTRPSSLNFGGSLFLKKDTSNPLEKFESFE